MWRCKHVSDALANHRYWELPWHKRIGLRLHVGLCLFCGRFQRQILVMQDAARLFLKHEEQDPPAPSERMPDDAKSRLREKLRKSA